MMTKKRHASCPRVHLHFQKYMVSVYFGVQKNARTALCSPFTPLQLTGGRGIPPKRSMSSNRALLERFHVCPLLFRERLGVSGAGDNGDVLTARPVYRYVFQCPGSAQALVRSNVCSALCCRGNKESNFFLVPLGLLPKALLTELPSAECCWNPQKMNSKVVFLGGSLGREAGEVFETVRGVSKASIDRRTISLFRT